MNKTPRKAKSKEESPPAMDDVLKRMLSTPPQPNVKPKPAAKAAEKKPAK